MLTFKLLGKCYLVSCPGGLKVAPWFYTSEVTRAWMCWYVPGKGRKGKGKEGKVNPLHKTAVEVTLVNYLYLQTAKH